MRIASWKCQAGIRRNEMRKLRHLYNIGADVRQAQSRNADAIMASIDFIIPSYAAE
jgi:hypothetical protein